MSTAFIFPGQGAQQPDMLHALPPTPETTRSFTEAQDVLGLDPLSLDNEDALASTVSVQLCLLVAGVAAARTLIARGTTPDLVAGMSIGAFPAAVIAGALDFSDALELVALRGRLMAEAFPSGYGMTALIGLDERRVARIIEAVHSPSAPVYLANCNADQQIVVAGTDDAMEKVATTALQEGATRAERLAVSVPSHCELLAPAAGSMRDAFAQVQMRRPRIDYLSASSARVLFDPEQIAEDLACNMARPVNWRDTARAAWERGVRLAIEMPSGNTLTGLTQPVLDDGLAVCFQNNALDTLVALAARQV